MKPPPQTALRPKRLRRALTCTALVLVLIAAVAWFARAQLLSFALRRAAHSAGVELTWESLEIEGARLVRLRGPSARRADDLDVSADRIELEIEPLRLVRGDWGGVRRIRVDRLRGRAGPFENRGSADTSGVVLPLSIELPRVEVTTRNLEFRLPHGRGLSVTDLVLAFDGTRATAEALALAWTDGSKRVEFPLAVRGAYREGRFEIERATWDPRLVFENARIDLHDARLGVARFEGALLAFGGEASIRGRVDENVLHLTAVVERLDAGSAARAYLPSVAEAARGEVDLVVDAGVPLEDPLRAQWSVRVDARDVHWKRDLDGLSFRARTADERILVEDGLVAHAKSAARFEGSLPPLTSDPCAWLSSIRVSADAVLGDVRALLEDDIGLALHGDAAWNRTPALVTAHLADGLVAARVRCADADLASIVNSFAGSSPIAAVVDVDAGVELDLQRPKRVHAEGTVLASDVHLAGHTIDTLTGHAAFGPQSVEVTDLSAASGPNRVTAAFVHLPRRALTADRIDQAQALVVMGLEAELGDVPALLGPSGPDAEFERFRAHQLNFSGELSDGEVRLSRGELVTDAGSARITRGRVPLHEDPAAILVDPALDVDLEVRFDDVGGAIAALAPRAFAIEDLPRGSVVGSARVRGDRGGPSASLSLGARDMLVRGILLEVADARMTLDQRELRVLQLDARGTIGSFALSGAYVFAEERLIDARLSADLVDLSRLAPGDLPSGTLTAEVRGDGRLGELIGDVELHGANMTYKGVRVDDVVVEARAASGSWTIDRASARGHGLEAVSSGRISSLAPQTTQRTIVLDSLDIAAGEARAASKSPITITQDGEAWTIDRLELEGEAGRLMCSFARRDGASILDAEASVRLDEDLPPLAGLEAQAAVVDARLHAVLRGRELEVETSGSIATQLESDRVETRAEWKASLREGLARIERLSITRGAGLSEMRVEASGEFPVDPLGEEVLVDGPLALRMRITAPDVSKLPFVLAPWSAAGSVELAADLAGTWSALLGTVDVQIEGVSADGVPALAGMNPLSGSLRLAFDERVRLDAADLTIESTATVRAAGTVAAPLDPRRLMRGDAGSLLDAPLDLAVRVDAPDLGPLAKRFPVLRRTRGEARADARATGTLRAPVLAGEGSLAGGEIRTTSNLPSVVGVSSRVHFDGREIVIDELRGEMGGAPFEMNGRIDLVGEVPTVALKLVGSSLLLWRERDVTVRADADLSLAGPLDALVLSGALALRDGRYTKKFDFLALGKRGPKSAGARGVRLFALDEPPFSTMRFDVQVESATPFSISSNVVRGNVSPSLVLLGTGALPELRGHLLVGPSRVLLPSGALKVRTGRIEFRPDRPDVPDLDIQASARLQGYDIEVNVSGSYDDPRIELSSIPPLPREDLALLLITGRPPGNALSGVGQRAAFDVAVYIARDVAVAWFESDEDEVESLAERIEVVIGADTTRSGADAFLVRLRLFGDLTTGRSAIFATGERDIYEFYNFGLRFVFAFE